MLRVDWLKLSKAWRLALALAFAASIAGASVSWALWQQDEYERQAQHQSAEHAHYARNYIRDRCVSLARLEKIDCATKTHDEHRAYQRDEQDLVAQKTSALWTMMMGLAATIGMVLSAVGVYLVWTTFAETRRANSIAREAILAETRPILLFHEFREIERRQAGAWCLLSPVWVNQGRDPCKILKFACSRVYADWQFFDEYVDEMAGVDPAVFSITGTVIIGPGEEFAGQPMLIKDDQLLPFRRGRPEKRPLSRTGYPEKYEVAIFSTQIEYISAFNPTASAYTVDTIQTCTMSSQTGKLAFDFPAGRTNMT